MEEKKKRGRPKKGSPILEKIKLLLKNDPTLTKEKLCVAADLKYHTFQNLYSRPVVSLGVLKSLLYAGVINQDDINKQKEWELTHG